MSNFQLFFGVRSTSNFSTGETVKTTVDVMKIQRDKMTNILSWLKNINTWLIQKHRKGWVTFQCQKTFWNIALAIKPSLRVEKRPNIRTIRWIKQLNKTEKNKFTHRGHNTSLWNDFLIWLYKAIVSQSPRLTSRYAKQLLLPGV